MKRLFIAINLPEEIKRQLGGEVEKIRSNYGPEVRFLDPKNWHLTIVFLAYQSDDSVDRINQAIAETAEGFPAPTIRFEKIIYGPAGRTPRMIWLTAGKETSEELASVKTALEEKLYEKGVNFRHEHREFQGHLTLARFRVAEARSSPLRRSSSEASEAKARFEAVTRQELPPLAAPFDRQFSAESLDLMESRLKRSGAEYDILTSYEFQATT